jgi:ketosteroid isomerase-like protein
MDITAKKINERVIQFAVLMLFLFVLANKTEAQEKTDNPRVKAIISAMNNSADEWNKGNLDAFMGMYDPSATMMMPTGPVGLGAIRDLYTKKYFDGNMPKQNLRYTDMEVRFLGRNYALLTGAFTLYGNNLPERSGRYSLVMIHTKHGWKILHDHSG